MKIHHHKPLFIFVLCAVLSLPMIGCEEEEIFSVSQEEEVERFIDDSYMGKAFFPNDFSSDEVTFTFPGDDTLYSVSFDNCSRYFTVSRLGDLIHLQTGDYYYAYASVQDRIYFTLRKTISDQVTESSLNDVLSRWGFLVKIGGNSQAYSGWLLQAVSASNLDTLNIATLDGSLLKMDYVSPLLVEGTTPLLQNAPDDYMDVDNTSAVGEASQIVMETCSPCVTIAHYETASGYVSEVLTCPQSNPSCSVDTFTVGSDDDVVWTSLTLQTICKVNDSTITHRLKYIPFKVDH